MSLPRRYRLSGKAAFSEVFEQSVVSADASFKVFGRATNEPECRLGLAVSRQVDKRAVARNRLKRIIRESFRSHVEANARQRPDADAEAGHQTVDVVVCPRRHAVSLENSQLFEQLSRHWRRIEGRVRQANAGPAHDRHLTSR